MAEDHYVFVGGHGLDYQGVTEKKSTPTEGISVFRFHGADGTLEFLSTCGGLLSPSFLALHPTQPVLYAIERHYESVGDGNGAVAALDLDDSSGALTLTSRVESLGYSSPTIAVHPSGRHAYVGHWSGEVVAYPIDESGRVGPADRLIHQGDQQSRLPREESHAQSVRTSRDGRFIFVPDRGLDAIFTYRTAGDGSLGGMASSSVDVPAGSGPRHLAWDPSERFAFTNGEMSSTLCVMAYDAVEGTFTPVSVHSTLPNGFAGSSSTAEVVCHPSGKAIYVSNRGHDSIAVFSFDPATGEARFQGTQPTFGHSPRNFAVDPAGEFIVAANQAPGDLVVFRVNPLTYWPEPTGFSIASPSPTCVVFRPLDGRARS